MIYKTINYLKDNQTIETYLINGEIWLSQKAMSALFKTSIPTVNRTVKEYEQNIAKKGEIISKMKFIPVKKPMILFDSKTILEIGKMLGYYDMSDFENWVNAQKGIKVDNNYQIFRYNRNNLTIDVKVSPEENTVWVTQDQLAEILDTTQQNISLHINNIYASKELERWASHKFFLCVQNINGREVKRQVGYYNLDMIISVAYRVNSRNGILFRQWATKVLKEVLINGYKALNNKEVTWNDFTNLFYEVKVLKSEVRRISEKTEKKEVLYMDGQYFDAFEQLKSIVLEATKSVTVIDCYMDDSTLSLLSTNKNIKNILLVTSHKATLTEGGINAFTKQFGNVSIYYSNKLHDRFIIIDKETIYHLGSSINNFGDRLTMVSKTEDEIVKASLLDFIDSIVKK